jgi:hypothetical protein
VAREFFSIPSTEYRTTQAPRIIVDLAHDRPIGALRYLERTDSHLFGVAEIDGSQLDEGPGTSAPRFVTAADATSSCSGLAVVHHPGQPPAPPDHRLRRVAL